MGARGCAGRVARASVAGTEPTEIKFAQEYVTVLAAQFPESLRVKKLEGLMWEAKGEIDLAMGEYDDMLQEGTPCWRTRTQACLPLPHSRARALSVGRSVESACH